MVEVVGAVIWKDGKFLICQRPAHKAQGLLWEFVGGKVESGETKRDALVRECREELSVELEVGDEFMEVTHDYPAFTIRLTVFHATVGKGEPKLLEHRAQAWIVPAEADGYAFCPADIPVVERLKAVEQQNLRNQP